MKRFLFLFGFILLLSVIYVSAEVTYPVSELGGCKDKQACETYCDDVNNMEACISFAEKNNLMTPEEIAEAKKFMPLMKSGQTPGGCKNQRECDAYCDKEENINICIDFALKAGVISSEEAAIVKKTGGKGPGGCKGKEECDAFCQKEENMQTCIDFAVQYGLMSEKDAEMQRKTGGKGPGGCKSKEECDAFCNNPDNMETCTNFAIEYGLMSPGEEAKMKESLEWMKSSEGQCVMQCMKEAGVSMKECGEDGSGPSACKECGDKCYSHDNYGNCFNSENWEQRNQECKSQGEDYYLQEVKGDNGQGGECVVDFTCVKGDWEKDYDVSDGTEMQGTQPGGAPGEEQYGQGPGDQVPQEGQIPEGERITQGEMPAGGGNGGSSPGEGGGAPGDEGGGGGPGDAPPSDGGGGMVDSGGGGSGGGGEAVTGAVIKENSGNSLIQKIIDFFINLFGGSSSGGE